MGGDLMSLENLISEFMKVKLEKPSNADELLDFVQKNYVCGNLSFTQYRALFHELNARGAKKPDYFNMEELNLGTR